MNGHGRGYGNARMLHRITVLGDGGVGKTALTVQFTMSSFVESYDPTIEDCYRKQWVVDDQPCMLEVLDTAGQEEYTALRNQWIKDGEGFLLVYSIESENSFNRIRDIFERVVETKRSLGEPRPPIILVGNKSDTSMREVLPEQGQQLARSLGVDSFFEVSAKRNLNVESAFKQLVQFMAGQKNGTWPPLPGQGGGSNRGSLGAGSTSNASGTGSGLAGGGGNAGRMGGGDAPRTKKKKRKNGCIIL